MLAYWQVQSSQQSLQKRFSMLSIQFVKLTNMTFPPGIGPDSPAGGAGDPVDQPEVPEAGRRPAGGGCRSTIEFHMSTVQNMLCCWTTNPIYTYPLWQAYETMLHVNKVHLKALCEWWNA